jgi:hypothetical protein
VVGFEKTTKFVDAHNEPGSMLSELTEMVKAGGKPLGFLGTVRRDRSSVSFYCRVFQEYANEEWVQGYFDALMNSVRKTAIAQGLRVLPAVDPEKN